ncbi:MAG: FAD-dependent oxidoreductase [Papillibacter sp.]|nr:FAD-dependent oxidoreductase [Papillibacter sp.]
MKSLWSDTVELPRYPALEKNIKTQAVVIGAGMAGILTARRLLKRGIETVVIEASHIGSGQTKNTTAKITSQHNVIYDSLIKKFGVEKARQYALANESAVAEYHDLIMDNHIDCDYEQLPAYIYSKTCSEPLEREAEAALSLGINASFTTKTSLPFPVRGALRFENQAQFHPLKFIKALAENLSIYENTRAMKVEEHTVITERGSIQADHIVFATHYPFINIPGYYFLRMHQERSYVIALEGADIPEGMYLGVDNDGLSFRGANGYLLLGGGSHRAGENSKGGQYDKLSEEAKRLYPGCRVAYRWSAQDCITVDGVPYIGRYASDRPYWYTATGFHKWGMSSSMVSAMLISDMICGIESPYSEVFTPQRFNIPNSAKNLKTEVTQVVKGLSREIFKAPEINVDHIPIGHGGIVEHADKKVGVYKSPEGRLYIVDIRCPHLGCQLEWNPDELSWDCPCHGSRFNYEGKLIDNPAQTDLEADITKS